MKHLLTVILLTTTLTASAQGQRRQWPTEPFKTDTLMVHDPVMAYENGTYYLYATGLGINMATSKDRKTWTVYPQGVLKDEIPAWTHDSVPEFKKHIWAPDIIRWHGRWWMMYSCSSFGVNTSAIGLISSPTLNPASPDYAWRDEGCVVASKGKRDDWNAIDPNIIIDDKDQAWMTWGSFWDGIQLIRLDETMHPMKGWKPRTIARRHAPGNFSHAEENPTSKFAGQNAIEAPFIMKHGGYYYLFVSWDYCCRGAKSNYRVAVGRSRSVEGPYVDRLGMDMRLGGGNLLIEGDKKEYEALGHCAAYHLNGEDIFICHGYSAPLGGASILVQKRIVWTSDGWPELIQPSK